MTSVEKNMEPSLGRATGLVFGFMWVFPYAIAGSLRMPDLLAIPATILAIQRVFWTRRVDGPVVSLGTIGILTLVWIFVEFHLSAFIPSHAPTRMILLRWVAAIPTAYYLCVLANHRASRSALLTGAVLGLALGALLIAYDYASFQLTGVPGFSDTPGEYAWALGGYRASAIYGHPNGAAIMGLLLIPFLIGLSEERRFESMAVVPALIAIVGGFVSTQSRGATLVSGALLVLWLLRRWRFECLLISGLGLLGLITIYAVDPNWTGDLLSSGGLSAAMNRFQTGTVENASTRLGTLAATLALVAKNPLGLGSTYVPLLHAATGSYATHNGVAHLTIMSGVAIGATVFAMLLYSAYETLTRRQVTESWVALYLVGVSMFEDILYVPSMPILVLWLVGSLECRLFHSNLRTMAASSQ